MKRLTTIILALVMCFGIFGTVSAEKSAAETPISVFAGGAYTGVLGTTGTAAGELVFNFLAGDPEEATKTVTTTHGTATISDDPEPGSYVYAAKRGVAGTEDIKFQVVDNGGTPSDALLKVTVVASNITAKNEAFEVVKGATVEKTLTYEGTLETDGAAVYSILKDDGTQVETLDTGKGTATIEANTGELTYVAGDTTGEDVIKFVVGDTKGGSSEGTITATITEPAASPTPSPTPYFNYVDIKGSWVEPYASKLAYDNTFVGAKISGLYYFQPEIMMTRADYVIYINAALGINPDDYKDLNNPFSDVGLPSWLVNQAKAAYDNGIISGIPWGGKLYFNPYDYLDRAQAVEMLNNALHFNQEVPESKTTLKFKDTASIPDWALKAVTNLVDAEIVNGYDDNTFRPFEVLNRATSTKLLSVAKDYLIENPLPTPSPTPTVSPSPSPTVSPSPTPDTSEIEGATLTLPDVQSGAIETRMINGELYRILK